MTHLVDRLAEIRATIKALQDEESDIRAAILAGKQNIVEGEHYTAILKLVSSNRFDTDGVKKEMGQSWYKAHTVATESIRIETIRKAA